MEKFYGFESWLKANDYVSWKSYISFMNEIEHDLGGIDLEKVNNTAYLKRLRMELQTKPVFMARRQSAQSDILSGFKTYITYIEQKRKN